ncbi:hypothetical protein [Acidovorax sp. CCYZU-2555]|uniref:hypothetical protein n=1 Tax=Acidovorax sp. CCYZU-2555 TaxID=2835042 RepID=UPI001BCB149A|nr:hypothetical protein [Acidovorax sp. CCYZU-2555]MBS7777708.1 hypothetical protein [Acidovorax sp. CCYZU-2555]
MTDIVPVPEGVHSTEFPTNADRTAGTFNPKVVAWGDSTRAQSVRDREIALTAYTNAVAAYETALAAGESQKQAAASALAAFNEANRSQIEAIRSEAGAASAWAAAAAAGAAAGLPSMVGKAGMTLTVNAAGNGVEWKAAGFEVGGIYVGAKKPTLGAWLDTDAVYLQSSYPVLFAALGLVPGVAPWNQRTPTGITTIRGVAHGNGMYVAVGTNASSAYTGASSPDGITWTARTVSAGEAAAFGNGVFVAVGTNVAASSLDGVTWTARTIGAFAWRGVTYAAGLFVAVAVAGQIATSPDGTTWTLRTSGLSNGYGVTYSGGKFVAFASNGQAASSVDGITWTALSSITGLGTLYGVVYGNGVWVAVGTRGAMTSPDLVTWTARFIPGVTASYGYTAVDFYSGRFIAIGATASGNEVFSDSPDGVTWTPRQIPVGAYTVLRNLNGLIIAAGTVMQTAPLFPYNTATQFYVPAPLGVVGLKTWIKAGD